LDYHIRQLTGLYPRLKAERVGLGLGVHESGLMKALEVLRVCNPLDVPVAEKKSTLPISRRGAFRIKIIAGLKLGRSCSRSGEGDGEDRGRIGISIIALPKSPQPCDPLSAGGGEPRLRC
jgi:hypothetical protein